MTAPIPAEEPRADTYEWTIWQWRCGSCGRFIAGSTVREWVELDGSAYYGIRDMVEGVCAIHGTIVPQYRPVRSILVCPDGTTDTQLNESTTQ